MYPTIFGSAPQGVPNPYVPHRHPYPTRFHGPVWTSARFGRQLQQTPAYRGGLVRPNPLSASPDGLGQDAVGITRSAFADAFIGAAVGFFGAPSKDDAVVYGVAGAAACGFGGKLGLVAVLMGLVVQSQRRASLRPELPWG